MSDLILVVDAERDSAEALTGHLTRTGYRIRLVGAGEAGFQAALQKPLPAVVVIDGSIRDMPATELCRRIRQTIELRDVPVIMISAKGDEVDRVVGFEVGADDYVVKPYSIRELGLRVRAILRRKIPSVVLRTDIRFGRLRLDPSGHRAWVDEGEIFLTALEYRLLSLFMARRGRAQSRDELLKDAWGITIGITPRTVDTHIKRLREKLGTAADYIETLRGVGYRFKDDPPGKEVD